MRYLILLSFLALSSCMTVGRIERNCDKFLTVCGTEVRYEVRYRDTIVPIVRDLEIQLPQSRIDVSGKLTYDARKKLQLRLKETAGIITTEVTISGMDYSVYSYLNDSSLIYQLRDSVKVEAATVEKTKIVKVPVRYVPAFARLFMSIGLGATIYVLIRLFLAYLKKKLP